VDLYFKIQMGGDNLSVSTNGDNAPVTIVQYGLAGEVTSASLVDDDTLELELTIDDALLDDYISKKAPH